MDTWTMNLSHGHLKKSKIELSLLGFGAILGNEINNEP